MNWLRTHRRSALVCGLTLLLPLLLYLQALSGLWQLRQEYQGDIDALVPRIARLQGLTEREEELGRSAGQVDEILAGLVYPVSADRAAVSAALQSDVRQLLGRAGLSVSNSQVLPVREEGDFDFIIVKLSANGNLIALDRALTEIAQFSPLLLVESLDVFPAKDRRGKNPEQKITVTLRLMSMRSV